MLRRYYPVVKTVESGLYAGICVQVNEDYQKRTPASVVTDCPIFHFSLKTVSSSYCDLEL